MYISDHLINHSSIYLNTNFFLWITAWRNFKKGWNIQCYKLVVAKLIKNFNFQTNRAILKSFYILLTEIFYYMLQKKILKAVCLGFVHIPKIGTVSFQIIEQKSVHCCENKMDADAWKASYWILSQNMKKEETKQI